MEAKILPGQRWPAAIWVVLALPITVLLALAWYAHPACDDYWYATAARANGFWGAQRLFYLTWTGRFTANAVQLGFPLALDMVRRYALIPLGLIAGFGICLATFLTALNRATGRLVSRRMVLASTLVFVSVYLAQMPSPCEGLFWLASGGTYFLPLLIAMLTVACPLAIRAENSTATKVVAAVVAAVLGLLTAGANESLLPPLGLLLLVATIAAFWRRHPSRWVWAAALLGFTLGAALVVLSPGNSVRAGYFHKSRLRALATTLPRVLVWFVRGPMGLGVTILAIPAMLALADKLPWTQRLTGRRVAAVAAVALGWVALAMLPALSMGLVPPARVLNVAYFFFLAGWFVTAFVAVAWLRQTRGLTRLTPRAVKIAWVCLVLGLLVAGNLPRAVYDLALVAPKYDRQMQACYASLTCQAAHPDPEDVIGKVTAVPRTIRPGDAQGDRNSCMLMAQYFGLKTAKPRVR